MILSDVRSSQVPFQAKNKIWNRLLEYPILLAVVSSLILYPLQLWLSGTAWPDAHWVPWIVLVAFLSLVFTFFRMFYRRALLEVHRQVRSVVQEAQQKVDEIAEQNLRIQKESVEGFARITEARDASSGLHIQRMKEYAKAIAQHMSTLPKFRDLVTQQYVQDIHIAAPLHDIGKVGTKDEILKKRGKLTGEEFELMKMHTIVGGDLMSELEEKLPGTTFFTRGREIAYHHHQRWDGTGYPNILTFGNSVAYFVEQGVGRALRGDEIPLSARIVALADVYDALRSRRVYKEPFSHESAIQLIREERGKHFDPDVVDAFETIEPEILQIASQFKD